MDAALLVAGWAAALALGAWALILRRRLELVGDAAHELRGPLAAVSLGVAARLRGRDSAPFEGELERMRTALADLDAARFGRRAQASPKALQLERLLRVAADGWRPFAWADGRGLSVRWQAGRAEVVADRGRLSQALGNLVANAVEHGSGEVEVSASRQGSRAVRVEVRDDGPAPRRPRHAAGSDRGRGLGIAARAVEEAGGSLTVDSGSHGTTATIELPLAEPASGR